MHIDEIDMGMWLQKIPQSKTERSKVGGPWKETFAKSEPVNIEIKRPIRLNTFKDLKIHFKDRSVSRPPTIEAAHFRDRPL